MHRPDEHTGALAGHRLPQDPQLVLSVARGVQWSRQKVWPDEHAPQTPAVHPCPDGHARPHAPQFAGSEAVGTQWSTQKVRPLGHAPHTPLLQL